VQISAGEKIGNFSSPSKLKIYHEGLSKKCPLFKSTYLETLRTSNQPWSVRQVADNIVISGDKKAANPNSFFLKKGEYITIPHDLHMRDPRYFKDPEKFDPERFLVRGEDGSLSIEIGTMRPYGGGPSMCKGRVFAERECLALVAGVLAFWDIEPADKKVGWVIPEQKKSSAISLPVHETRVRIRPRGFE
jgi:cytochrome P450